jgi:hypothetical protein
LQKPLSLLPGKTQTEALQVVNLTNRSK